MRSALPMLLAQYDGSRGPGMGVLLVELAVVVVVVAGCWKVFEKAGKPGWAAIVPIYNLIVLLQIVDKPIWWIILFFIPIVGLVVAILVCIELARRFGKGVGFGLGLAILGFIFFPILGFGDAKYQGGAATSGPGEMRRGAA